MILYTKGKAGNPRKELKNMLKYFERSVTDNVTNPDIESVHHMVDRIKEQTELNISYMKSWEECLISLNILLIFYYKEKKTIHK